MRDNYTIRFVRLKLEKQLNFGVCVRVLGENFRCYRHEHQSKWLIRKMIIVLNQRVRIEFSLHQRITTSVSFSISGHLSRSRISSLNSLSRINLKWVMIYFQRTENDKRNQRITFLVVSFILWSGLIHSDTQNWHESECDAEIDLRYAKETCEEKVLIWNCCL